MSEEQYVLVTQLEQFLNQNGVALMDGTLV